MKNCTIAIIGAGNMGASLVGGLIGTGIMPEKLWVTDTDAKKLQYLNQEFSVNTSQDNLSVVEQADVVILAVKPQILPTLATQLTAAVQTRQPLMISIAAGIREQQLQNWLGDNVALIRCMPNTPALVRCGAAALHANSHVSDAQRELAENILRAVGSVVWLDDEKQMDAVTALSGSGPAYFFLMIEALQDAGEKMGLSAETAKLLTQQTALGAARMAMESDKPIAELRKQVTSKGGTTEAALNVLEEKNFRNILADALFAAKKRSEELGPG